ncbi:DUF4352 domain-containing protein [Actinobaculum sp. 352]|uniref:DUF4352 domain-containing protein n=1 Tax=Actinobaculum sp. 352 TaxID=2490946 RepID=UPI000F7EB5EF|nr:DUF4352 domain-containing protein [Actinobaculum sp. 352]RTE48206.1 DUF4352 domain-containing protein [Actinobaculum sp. 352]
MSQSSGGFGGPESQRFAPPSQRAAGQQGTPQQPAVPGQPGQWVPQGSQPQAQRSQYGQAAAPGQYGASYPSGQPGWFGQSGSYGAGGGAGSYPGATGGQAPSSGQFAGYGSYGAGAYPGGPVGPGQPLVGGVFGSGPSGRRGFPVWGWVLVAVAAVGVVVGILFATGVFGGGDKEADPTRTPSAVAESSPSSLSTTPSEDTTTPTPTSTTPVAEKIDEYTARVNSLNLEAVEYNPDATEQVLKDPSKVLDSPTEGQKIVGVKFKIKNIGSEPMDPFSDLGGPYFYTADGELYPWFGYWGDGALILVGELSQGEEAEAWVYFDVPQDFSPESAELQLWAHGDSERVRIAVP